jgi:hypothetical protein
MATRAIVTSQPEVVCGICGRHLLRGERSLTFVADTQAHAVCDLCTARARQAGWIPAAEVSEERDESGGKPRRNHALTDLLRRWRPGGAGAVAADARRAAGADNGSASSERAPDLPYAASIESGLAAGGAHAKGGLSAGAAAGAEGPGPAAHTPGSAADACGLAIEIFNHTEQSRRIAGIARSLGAPRVTVRRADAPTSTNAASAGPRELDSHRACVAIIAAWELCWYRWEVRLAGDGTSSLELAARGTRLDELPAEDLAGNADVDERGSVSFA